MFPVQLACVHAVSWSPCTACVSLLNLPFQIFEKTWYLVAHVQQMLYEFLDYSYTVLAAELVSSLDFYTFRHAGLFGSHSLDAA